jgi:beta-fructofuranosidase
MNTLKDSRQEWLEQAPIKRQTLANDSHRPRYHFLPPNNWMNDPNGLIYWQGQYHMFYQHNPNNPFWGDIHWGHAVSDDLVHWRDLPPALTPEMPPVDDGGCWSGSAVDNNGVPTILYTGIKNREQTTCIATSNDGLLTWQKDQANPILKAPQHPGFRHQDYRDPFVWREGDTWYQVISMTINNQGQALIYRSSNLREWEYLHPLIPQDVRETLKDIADIWECPNFFALGDKWVLLVSMWKNHTLLYPAAFIGEFRDLEFYPEQYQRLDWGQQCMYAPLTFLDNQHRRLMFGWLQEQRSKEAQIAADWSGVMSLPRVLSLENNVLKISPAPELASLRLEVFELEHKLLSDVEETLDVQGAALELKLELELTEDAIFTLALHASPDKIEQTLITYDNAKKELSLDTSHSSLDPHITAKNVSTTHTPKGNTLTLHIFLDHSAIEIFADNETCITSRLYPTRPDSLGLGVLARKGEVSLKQLCLWKMASIWETQSK